MNEKTARRFLSRNAHKIAKRNLDRRFGWIGFNSFDQTVLKAKEATGQKRTIKELLFKKF